MLITALTKFTSIDYPGKLACVIFTGGCNLRCGFCHNAEFVLPEKVNEMKIFQIPFEVVLNFLKSRRGLLEGVVICGGEPTVQPDLIERIREIKELGFAVKLDTNGSNPEVLENVLREGLVDYVAMDIKDTPDYRKELIGVNLRSDKIRKSIELIKASEVDYEFRTTVIPEFHNLEILMKMGESIQGSKRWTLQLYRNGKTLDPEFSKLKEYNKEDLEALAGQLFEYSEKIIVR